MDELSREFAEDSGELVSGTGVAGATAELRKRRSTRIVQAVPLSVAGVDALGRPFMERTSTLIVNCHGCRYQSKHYVLKNMWVTLEVPHPESGLPPRTVRGRVAWIQRPRTVRQLFQVALELEVAGNAWGIAFPPEDWFAFPDVTHPDNNEQDAGAARHAAAAEESAKATAEMGALSDDFSLPLTPPDISSTKSSEKLRLFTAPGSTTDASMQLARQVTRLVADARQQIQAAAREAAAQAVSAEHRIRTDQWEQQVAAARADFSSEAAAAMERIQQDSASLNLTAQNVAAEALRRDLPRWLAPQLEELARDLSAQLLQEAMAQRQSSNEQASADAETLRTVCRHAEELSGRLREYAHTAQSLTVAGAEASVRAAEEAARRQEESLAALRRTLAASAAEVQERLQEQINASATSAQLRWDNHITGELEAAQGRVEIAVDNAVARAQGQVAESVNAHANGVLEQLQQETRELQSGLREAAVLASSELDLRLSALQEAAQVHAERIEAALSGAREVLSRFEQFPERLESAQQHALAGFQAHLDDVLSLHRNELHRRSESLFGEIGARIRSSFDEITRDSAAQFREQVESLAQPQVTKVDEALQRLAGTRSMLDAAMSLQQERIRAIADEAFAEALAQFRGNLGSVEQLLRESAESVAARSLADFEARAEAAKHHVVEDLLKSAEWYEKKAQTQIHHLADKAGEHAESSLRERAGEISNMFAGELDHASRNFIAHTQTQIEEVVRDAFERARALFSEAAETTSAAFIDEIQRQARHELGGFEAEAQKSVDDTRARMQAAHAELTQKVTVEQEDFLRRFQGAMSGAMDASVSEANQKVQAGFGPLLDAWRSMTAAHQAEMNGLFARAGDQAAEHFRGRLENVSNQWMLATVASLDHQSREVVSGIAATAEEKLRDTCTKVFADIGDTLRERLAQITSNFGAPAPPLTR